MQRRRNGTRQLHRCASPRLLQRPIAWQTAVGVVPRVATLPHFDRMRSTRPNPRSMRQASDDDIIVLGIDEDTALTPRRRRRPLARLRPPNRHRQPRPLPDQLYHPGDEFEL